MSTIHPVAFGARSPSGWQAALRHCERASAWPEARRQCVVAGLCFVLLVCLGAQRLSHPGLWAEDGAVFFAQALEQGGGLAQGLRPYAGYYHLVPRLVTAFAMVFPLPLFAVMLTLVCFGLYAALASVFSLDAYRWLIKSDALRCAISLMWVLLPGANEVIGNVCNLHTPLFMYLAILAWRDLLTPLTALQWGLAFLAMGSEGGIVVLIPVFLGRFFLQLGGRRFSLAAGEATCLTLLAGWALAHWLAHQQAVQSGLFVLQAPRSTLDFACGLARFAVERFAAFPVLGRPFCDSVRRHDLWRLWALGLPLAALILALLRRLMGWRRMTAALIVPGAVMGLSVVTWVVRVESQGAMETFSMNHRYFLATGPFAWTLWAAALERCTIYGRYLAAGFLLLAASMGLHYREFLSYEAGESWASIAQALHQAQGPACGEVSLPQAPEGWRIHYRRPEG